PFGFLFPLTQKEEKRTFSRTLLFTLLLTLSIELLQPIINDWRSNDVTDIITNTIGGLIGYGIYLLFRPISVPILNNIREKKN
ncbi:MAG: VanZ family protein, partial [Erysipelotrichia bacterium]|nr:VanZ family protein [Erysipelotrichia bacterium]